MRVSIVVVGGRWRVVKMVERGWEVGMWCDIGWDIGKERV